MPECGSSGEVGNLCHECLVNIGMKAVNDSNIKDLSLPMPNILCMSSPKNNFLQNISTFRNFHIFQMKPKK